MSDEENEPGLTPGIDPSMEPGLEPGADFDDFEGDRKEGSIGELIRTNPLAKIGVIGGVLLIVIGGVILFGGKKPPQARSRVANGNQVTETPGTNQVPESYRKAVEETDQQRVETAIKTGTSAMPTPIAPPVGRVELPDDSQPEEDPLDRWRRIQEERQKRVEATPELPKTDPNAETIQALAQAMSQQMTSLITAKAPQGPRHVDITDEHFLDKMEAAAQAAADAANSPAASNTTTLDVVIPAGTIEYAQLLIEANSDVPGPIMAQLASGPLAGAKMLGSFTNNEDFVTLNFDTVVVNGVSYGISAIALNPDTANIGMLTDIDHKYFQRIVLPAAAAFIEGFGSAVAQTDSTTVDTGSGTTVSQQSDLNVHQEIMKGVSEGASKLSEIIDDQADTKPQLRVRAGTPMGILFLQPVTKDSADNN
jgi:intracellular multiplication protein IcmE